MRGQEFLAQLREQVLIGCGALGTMISERGIGRETNYERLNLTNPEFIQDLHSAYLAAGSQFIETNTFGANRTKLALFNFAEDGKEGRRAGLQICQELVECMMSKADGFYIIPSQIRTEMAVELVDYIHRRVPRLE
jgi:methionine synthase I (cobalamin-dependent)